MKIDWGPQHPQQYADSALMYLMDGNSPFDAHRRAERDVHGVDFDAPRDEQGNLRKALELREPAAQPTIPNDLSFGSEMQLALSHAAQMMTQG
jgi:hypothetical protein